MTKQTIATIFFRDGANNNFNILRVLLTLSYPLVTDFLTMSIEMGPFVVMD